MTKKQLQESWRGSIQRNQSCPPYVGCSKLGPFVFWQILANFGGNLANFGGNSGEIWRKFGEFWRNCTLASEFGDFEENGQFSLRGKIVRFLFSPECPLFPQNKGFEKKEFLWLKGKRMTFPRAGKISQAIVSSKDVWAKEGKTPNFKQIPCLKFTKQIQKQGKEG